VGSSLGRLSLGERVLSVGWVFTSDETGNLEAGKKIVVLMGVASLGNPTIGKVLTKQLGRKF
jgi:hypothetical protein